MTQLNRIVPEDGVRGVYNGTGGTLSEGTFVKTKSSGEYLEIEAAAGNDDPVLGVLMADLATGTRGDCQVKGKALVLASTTIAIGARVMPTTGGKSLTTTVGHAVVGVAQTAGATDTLHEVELTAVGGAEMPG
jgi:hypothetical protein